MEGCLQITFLFLIQPLTFNFVVFIEMFSNHSMMRGSIMYLHISFNTLGIVLNAQPGCSQFSAPFAKPKDETNC